MAGIALTNGADLVLGSEAVVDIAGPLAVADGSTVDISSGSISVGAITIADGGIIDFKDRKVDDGQLTVKG
ncbi:MAG: hypothetical protein PHW08_02195, partial [Kiritimatiellae bacterium]|nr:hypothetical protein [Kiritimatiellia bacterium]